MPYILFLHINQLRVFVQSFTPYIYFDPLSSMGLNHSNSQISRSLILFYLLQGESIYFWPFQSSSLFIEYFLFLIYLWFWNILFLFVSFPFLLPKTLDPSLIFHFYLPLHVPHNSVPGILSYPETNQRFVGWLIL